MSCPEHCMPVSDRIFMHGNYTMLKGVTIPTVKDRFGDKSSVDNFREIMNSSCFFKVFEYCILPILKSYTQISPLQFGYRPNTSTLSATTIFKEIVNTFLEDDSVVYMHVFLDLSKAFE